MHISSRMSEERGYRERKKGNFSGSTKEKCYRKSKSVASIKVKL